LEEETALKKIEIKPNTLLYPVPVLLVSSGTEDGRTNIMTAGWTGTVCTKPPMTYVSIRPSRVSYDMIRQSGEFVLNLNTQKLATAADQCGVISARECPDKWAMTGLTRGKASHLQFAPIIMESPLNIECKLKDIIPLGCHHMFLGDVVGIDASEEYVGNNGLIHLENAELIAYSIAKTENNVPVGSYVKLGEAIGRYGFTASEDIRTH
jgi:flavin reductase (DIM6/NTAB) family NADH-FMN oxidoreductase RutF